MSTCESVLRHTAGLEQAKAFAALALSGAVQHWSRLHTVVAAALVAALAVAAADHRRIHPLQRDLRWLENNCRIWASVEHIRGRVLA